jgi:glutamate-1-semialdehyde 2,1-aminomutase
MKSFIGSIEKLAQSKQFLAGGVASSLRGGMAPTPLFAQSAEGVRVKDVDGNEYIDYLLAYGPLILGHAHPELNRQITQALNQGHTYGLQHDGEIALAKRLTEILPCADKVSLSGSGTEAVMLALRLSRAYTGRTKVVRFYGHYHGWSDSIFISFPSLSIKGNTAAEAVDNNVPGTAGQSEKSLEDVILIPWNDFASLEAALRAHKDEIAAIITEPIMCNSGCILPKPGYLELMRQLTIELGIVMIFDEVITGFRLGLGGAQDYFGIKPDLVTVGKALGGGIAISAVGGKREIMQLIDDGTVSHLGTLNGNCVSTAAALTVLEVMSQENGAAYQRMNDNADTLVKGIRALLQQHQISGIVNQAGPVFHMMFTDQSSVTDFTAFQKRDAVKYAEFAAIMLEEGILIRPNGLWYICAAHQMKDIKDTLEAMDRSLQRLLCD